MTSRHFNSNEEARKEWALVLHPVQMLPMPGQRYAGQPRAAEPLFLCLQAGLTPLDETCHLLTNTKVTALQLGPVIHKQDDPCAGLSPACTPGPRALPPPDEET